MSNPGSPPKSVAARREDVRSKRKVKTVDVKIKGKTLTVTLREG